MPSDTPTVASEYNRIVARNMREDELQYNVIDAMHRHGWRVAHFRPAKTDRGWRTAVQGDGGGFPDLICVKGSRLLVAELKRQSGTLTPVQQRWLDDFAATGAEVYTWKPLDWLNDTILDVLRREP